MHRACVHQLTKKHKYQILITQQMYNIKFKLRGSFKANIF